MIIDSRLKVSALQALTATAVSTNVINLGSRRLIGPGDPMWWVIIARAALGGTTPTFQASVQTDDAEGFGSPTTLQSSQQLTTMPVGTQIVLPMTFTNEQFLRLNYTLGGTSPTVTIDAFLTNQDPVAWMAYANGID